VRQQIEGNIIFGLQAALYGNITLKDGRVEQSNFHQYLMPRMSQTPAIDITLVPSTEKPGGIGEPGMALLGPTMANALHALTGKRYRKMPFDVA
jgi:isoquinoline 1-oxidoreductase beta subunit